MEFIASLIRSLAWPTVILVVALLFRSKIIELLTPAIRRFKAGPFEVEWDRAISEAEVKLEQPGLTPIEASITLSGSLVAELGPLAKSMPSAAVMEAAARVEGELQSKVADTLSGWGFDVTAPAGLGALSRFAHKYNVISAETARAIEGLAVLRNMAVHGRAADTTAGRALDYLHLADAVMFAMSHTPGTGGRSGVAEGGDGGIGEPGSAGVVGSTADVGKDGLALGGEGSGARHTERGAEGGRGAMGFAAEAYGGFLDHGRFQEAGRGPEGRSERDPDDGTPEASAGPASPAPCS
jgi:hypothetical protein